MIVNKTNAMIYLLNSLGIIKYKLKSDTIELDMDVQELMYSINSSSEAVQNVYGQTDEWKELTGLFVNKL